MTHVSLRAQLVGFAIAGAVCVGVGAVLAITLRPTPRPGPPVVQTDTVYMEHERPPAKPSLGERIRTAGVKPTQTRVADRPSAAGKKAVAIYCAPVKVPSDSGKSDGKSRESDGKSRESDGKTALLPDFGGRRRGPWLTLYSTLNDGRRWSADYKVRGRLTWISSGDSVLVRGDRLWIRLLRGAAKCAVVGGSGELAGRVLGARPGVGAGIAGVACAGSLAF